MVYPVIVALDELSLKDSLKIAQQLKGLVWGFKVHELLLREGFGVIRKLKKYGNVFVDLKLHDIPHTIELEVKTLVGYGADIITVHASGGKEMLKAAVDAGKDRIAAVTVLTSLPPAEARKVPHLASLARTAGISTIVCSPREVGALRKLWKTAHFITPGIRGLRDKKTDHKRTSTPEEALKRGATLLVIGRPITKVPDPRQALQELFSID